MARDGFGLGFAFSRQKGLPAFPKRRCGGCGLRERKGWQLWCSRCNCRLPRDLHALLMREETPARFWSLVRVALRLLKGHSHSADASQRQEVPRAH